MLLTRACGTAQFGRRDLSCRRLLLPPFLLAGWTARRLARGCLAAPAGCRPDDAAAGAGRCRFGLGCSLTLGTGDAGGCDDLRTLVPPAVMQPLPPPLPASLAATDCRRHCHR